MEEVTVKEEVIEEVCMTNYINKPHRLIFTLTH